MATFRGSKGSVTIGGTVVGELQRWALNIARAHMETTAMGGVAKTGKLDLPGGTGTLALNLDGGNTQHAALINILLSDADSAPLAGVFLAATGKSFTCNFLPTSGAITAQRGSIITIEVTFETDGAITMQWA